MNNFKEFIVDAINEYEKFVDADNHARLEDMKLHLKGCLIKLDKAKEELQLILNKI